MARGARVQLAHLNELARKDDGCNSHTTKLEEETELDDRGEMATDPRGLRAEVSYRGKAM